jgi:hypothetical protein
MGMEVTCNTSFVTVEPRNSKDHGPRFDSHIAAKRAIHRQGLPPYIALSLMSGIVAEGTAVQHWNVKPKEVEPKNLNRRVTKS